MIYHDPISDLRSLNLIQVISKKRTLKPGFHYRISIIKHKDIRTRRMAYLTQFSIPALLNPMINKMADEASAILLLLCLHEVWVKVTYDWSTNLCLCLCLC